MSDGELLPEEKHDVDLTLKDVGGALDFIGRLAGILPRRDPLYELRLRREMLELQRLTEAPIPVSVPWPQLVESLMEIRQDHVILGDRGSGKSALAFGLAAAARATGRTVVAVGLPEWACEAVGFIPVKAVKDVPRGVFALVDEAGSIFSRLASRRREPGLIEQLAIARHRDVSWCWVAQSAAALDRQVLRTEALVWAKRMDPFRTRFDREELAGWMTLLLGIQANWDPEDREVVAVYAGNEWLITRNPLPPDWSERISMCFG